MHKIAEPLLVAVEGSLPLVHGEGEDVSRRLQRCEDQGKGVEALKLDHELELVYLADYLGWVIEAKLLHVFGF